MIDAKHQTSTDHDSNNTCSIEKAKYNTSRNATNLNPPLRRQPLNPPLSILALPLNTHIPEPIMQATPTSLPELHRLRHKPNTAPKRRQGNILNTRKPLLHLLNLSLQQRPPILKIRLLNINRNNPIPIPLQADHTLPPLIHLHLLRLRSPQNPTLPTRPSPNTTPPLPRPPIQLTLLPPQRLKQPLNPHLPLNTSPTKRQRAPFIPRPDLRRDDSLFRVRFRHGF